MAPGTGPGPSRRRRCALVLSPRALVIPRLHTATRAHALQVASLPRGMAVTGQGLSVLPRTRPPQTWDDSMVFAGSIVGPRMGPIRQREGALASIWHRTMGLMESHRPAFPRLPRRRLGLEPARPKVVVDGAVGPAVGCALALLTNLPCARTLHILERPFQLHCELSSSRTFLLCECASWTSDALQIVGVVCAGALGSQVVTRTQTQDRG